MHITADICNSRVCSEINLTVILSSVEEEEVNLGCYVVLETWDIHGGSLYLYCLGVRNEADMYALNNTS